MKRIDDILTQLQQQQPDVINPDELTDRIMDSLPDMDVLPMDDGPERKSAKRTRLYIYSAIAVAAGVLLLLTLNLNPNIRQDETISSSEKVRPVRKRSPLCTEKESVPYGKAPVTPVGISRESSEVAEVRRKKQTDRQLVVQHTASPAREGSTQRTASNADSLDYYIAKIERELTQVDESLYIERMQKLIHADERLQHIVNNYLLHQLDKDGRPMEAINTNNVNTTENEE